MKKHDPCPPMDLDNIREQGVRRLVAYSCITTPGHVPFLIVLTTSNRHDVTYHGTSRPLITSKPTPTAGATKRKSYFCEGSSTPDFETKARFRRLLTRGLSAVAGKRIGQFPARPQRGA